jgi:hypothetical protein
MKTELKRAMKKTLRVASGHTMFVKSIDRSELPKGLDNARDYTSFYVVKNWDDNGCTFMYLGKGYKSAPNEIVAWYPKGAFWSGYGKNIKDAIEGAQKDGWMYA